jgi:hypothetical protein
MEQGTVKVIGLEGEVAYFVDVSPRLTEEQREHCIIQAGEKAKEIAKWLHLLNRWNGRVKLQILRDPFEMYHSVAKPQEKYEMIRSRNFSRNYVTAAVPQSARRWRRGYDYDYEGRVPLSSLEEVHINTSAVKTNGLVSWTDAISTAKNLYVAGRWDGKGQITVLKLGRYFSNRHRRIVECDQGFYEIPEDYIFSDLGIDYQTEGFANRPQCEIDELKRQWEADPNWDIEETEGFEGHREELSRYHQQKMKEWKAQRDALRNRREVELLKKGVPENLLDTYLETEGRFDHKKEQAIDNLYYMLDLSREDAEVLASNIVEAATSKAMMEIMEKLGSL